LSEVCAVTPREEAIKAGNQEAASAVQSFAVGDSPAGTTGYRKGARPQCAVLLLASADKVIE
jgi:hypothetical protein